MTACMRMSVISLFILATHATFAQNWTGGSTPIIGSGTSVTVSTAEPNIVRFTDNGTLTIVSGGSVTTTGMVVTAVGSGTGESGTLTMTGGSLTSQTAMRFVVGYLGGEGIVNIGAGATLTIPAGRFVLAGNEEGQRGLPSRGEVFVSGTLSADMIEFTGYFPNTTPAAPYAESARLTLNTGGIAEARVVNKNDYAASVLFFNGGTLRAKPTATELPSFMAGAGVLDLVIADDKEMIFDSNGRIITIAPQASPNENLLTLRGENGAGASGNGRLKKIGAGTLTFRLPAACNTFTGAITVVEGVLNLGRPLAPNQTVTVHSGASFILNVPEDAAKVTVLGGGKTVYAVGSNTDSLDLTVQGSAYYDDRLGSPAAGNAAMLSGTLTHNASVGMVGAPFRLIGLGGSLNLTNTGLEAKAIQVEGSGIFAFEGNRTITAADVDLISITDGEYRQVGSVTLSDPSTPASLAFATGRFTGGGRLNIGAGGGEGHFSANGVSSTFSNLRVGDGTGSQGSFSLSSGTVVFNGESLIGAENGTGTLTVTGGEFFVYGDLRLAGNVPSGVRTQQPAAQVLVSNALLRCNTLNFTPSWTDNNTTTRTLEPVFFTLGAGGVTEMNFLNKNDDPIGTLIFDGGKLRARASRINNESFLTVGQSGTLRVLNTPGNDITIDTQNNILNMSGGSGKLTLGGEGGFRKLGGGRLTFTSAAAITYKGNTSIDAGTLILGASDLIPHGAETGHVQIAQGAALDLNGKNETINRLIGNGSVFSTNGAAVLGVLADGSSDTWNHSWFSGDITFDKQGAGTLTIASEQTPAKMAVSKGTVRVAPAEGFPFYRFKIEAVKTPGANNQAGMQLTEIALFCDNVDVTSNRIGIEYDSTGGVGGSLATSAFPSGETPEYAVDGIVPSDSSKSKWLDFRLSPGRTLADRDRVWLRINFAAAQRITHYNWATGNDAPDRDPAAWRFQGSHNGLTWTDLDVKTNYVATGDRNAWVTENGFSVTSQNTAADTVNDAETVIVREGATLLLDGVSETIGGLAGAGTITINDATLTADTPAGMTNWFGGTLNGNGAFAKTGEGAQNFHGAYQTAGDLTVKAGNLVLGDIPYRWFRFTVKKNKSNVNVTQFSELALYGADGKRQNIGLTLGTNVETLTPGQVASPAAYALGNPTTENASMLFDGLTTTKWCPNFNTPSVTDPATHRTVVMRLDNDASAITAYNLCSANDYAERDPITWTLETSADGDTWIPLDTRTDVVPPTARFTWYNDGTPFPVEGHRVTTGTTGVIPSTAVIEVGAGATLTANNGTDTIGALRVDMQGAGTLTRLNPATGGSLYLVNTTGNPSEWNIPLTILSVTDTSALSSWTIYADGVKLGNFSLRYDAETGTLRLGPKGTILLIL